MENLRVEKVRCLRMLTRQIISRMWKNHRLTLLNEGISIIGYGKRRKRRIWKTCFHSGLEKFHLLLVLLPNPEQIVTISCPPLLKLPFYPVGHILSSFHAFPLARHLWVPFFCFSFFLICFFFDSFFFNFFFILFL